MPVKGICLLIISSVHTILHNIIATRFCEYIKKKIEIFHLHTVSIKILVVTLTFYLCLIL